MEKITFLNLVGDLYAIECLNEIGQLSYLYLQNSIGDYKYLNLSPLDMIKIDVDQWEEIYNRLRRCKDQWSTWSTDDSLKKVSWDFPSIDLKVNFVQRKDSSFVYISSLDSFFKEVIIRIKYSDFDNLLEKIDERIALICL